MWAKESCYLARYLKVAIFFLMCAKTIKCTVFLLCFSARTFPPSIFTECNRGSEGATAVGGVALWWCIVWRRRSWWGQRLSAFHCTTDQELTRNDCRFLCWKAGSVVEPWRSIFVALWESLCGYLCRSSARSWLSTVCQKHIYSTTNIHTCINLYITCQQESKPLCLQTEEAI